MFITRFSAQLLLTGISKAVCLFETDDPIIDSWSPALYF
jgi:hypothetical protein